MTRILRSPIRRKLIGGQMLTVGVALLLACCGYIVTEFFMLRSTRTHDLRTIAQMTGIETTAALTFGDREAATEILSAFRAKPSVEAARVYDVSGAPFATYLSGRGFVPPARPAARVEHTSMLIETCEPIDLNGRRIGAIYISSNIDSIVAQMLTSVKISFSILLAAFAVAFMISFRLQRSISRPIVHLSRVVGVVSREKDYAIRARIAAEDDEIGELVRGFNGMLGEIQRRDEGLEKEVAARTAQVKRILDTAGEGIFELDAEGRTTFVNPSAALMLGLSANSLSGLHLHELLHAGDDEQSAFSFETCRVCGTHHEPPMRSGTTWFKPHDRDPIPVEYTSNTIVRDDGTREGVVVTFRDISERLAVDKMKSEFVSTVSHELRTPLTSIRGALGLLAAGLLGNTAPRAERMLEIAINNSDRLVRLINDILDLERMDSGRVELHCKVLDARDLLRQAADGVQTMADRAKVQLVVDEQNETVWADPDRLMQLLTNLVSNAVKFSPAGARVTLSVRSDGEQVTFRVADEGRGIPADKLEMIFERFKQVDASDSRDKGGTGLGLAICRSIAAAHGGRIWAESDGNGSVFQFTLPVMSRNAETAAPAELMERTVLLCEEHGQNMTAVASMLERHGLKTVYAASPQDLCRSAAATHPDAVLFDLEEKSDIGWRIVERLKACNATREIPIIVAAMEQSDSLEAHSALIAGWVRKPYDEKDLVNAVTLACDRPLILIVEDDRDLARITSTSLETHGVETVHATTGREAVDVIVNRRPDLIVLDLVLPEMDGFALVDWLKKSNSLAHIPLIVYSALELNAEQRDRLRLGPTEFLIKSRVSLEEFEEEVVRLLSLVTTEMETKGAA